VRQLVFNAHDIVGYEKINDAIEKLNQVIDIIGLDKSKR
jgi:hypothetical protein